MTEEATNLSLALHHRPLMLKLQGTLKVPKFIPHLTKYSTKAEASFPALLGTLPASVQTVITCTSKLYKLASKAEGID